MGEFLALFWQNLVLLHGVDQRLAALASNTLLDAFQQVGTELLTRYPDLTLYQRARMLTFTRWAGGTLGEAYKGMAREIERDLTGLAGAQSEFATKLLTAQVAVIPGTNATVEFNTVRLTPRHLTAIAQYPVEGLSLGDWWANAGQKAALGVKRQVQLGLVAGEPTQAIVRRIVQPGPTIPGRPERSTEYRRARQGATAVVRTAITSVSSQAQFETYKRQDPRVTDSYEYVATLDDRTTLICITLDGTVWAYDDPTAPRPPQHINCRSSIVPKVNWEALGLPMPEELAPTRASQTGPTKARNYEAWLREQPVTIQNEALGVGIAKLWREGKVSLKDLIKQDKTEVTLEQLRKKLKLAA